MLQAREAFLDSARNDTVLAVAESYFNVQQARGELASALDVSRRANPRLRWRVDLGAEVNSSPAYANGMVYVGTDGGNVYGLNARTGRVRWRSS